MAPAAPPPVEAPSPTPPTPPPAHAVRQAASDGAARSIPAERTRNVEIAPAAPGPVDQRAERAVDPEGEPAPAAGRGPAPHPEIVRHAAAAFNARVTNVVRKNRPAP